MTIDMTLVYAKSTELDNNLSVVLRELKRVASAKTRMKQQVNRPDYNAQMTIILQEEELLKSVRDYLRGPRKNANTLTAEQIATMDYDQVRAAIKCIQTKKTHTRWDADCEQDENGLFIPGTGKAYKEAERIEDMLKARREELEPTHKNLVRTSDLLCLIDTLRTCPDITVDACLDRIEAYVKRGENDA